jgi:hypothetical protein
MFVYEVLSLLMMNSYSTRIRYKIINMMDKIWRCVGLAY